MVSVPLLFSLNLNRVCRDNRKQQAGVTCVHFCVARGVPHLGPVTNAIDQSRLTKNTHMLRESRFWNGMIKLAHQLGAVARAFLIEDFNKKRHTHRISERVQDGFKRNIFDGGMDERLHLGYFSYCGRSKYTARRFFLSTLLSY